MIITGDYYSMWTIQPLDDPDSVAKLCWWVLYITRIGAVGDFFSIDRDSQVMPPSLGGLVGESRDGRGVRLQCGIGSGAVNQRR